MWTVDPSCYPGTPNTGVRHAYRIQLRPLLNAEQSKGDSFRRQTEAAEKYAREHHLTLDKRLNMQDLGVSAYRGDNVRKGALGAFLKAVDDDIVEKGAFLLVENLDRVSRANPWDAMPIFQQIINAGVTIVTLVDQRTWSKKDIQDNPFRIMESLMVMIRANEESKLKSHRLKGAWLKKRRAAGTTPMTAVSPAWLRLDKTAGKFLVVKDRAAVVKRIFAMAQKGMGQHRIASTFNREGVLPFGNAKHWHRQYVAKVLENSAVIGTLIPHEVVYNEAQQKGRKAQDAIPGYYPAIISERTFNDLKAQRQGTRAPTVRLSKAGTVTSFLANLAKCPACGGTMTRVTKGGATMAGDSYLVCAKAKVGAGCKYVSVRREVVESAIIQHIEQLIGEAPSGDNSIDSQLEGVTHLLNEMADRGRTLMAELERRPSTTIRKRLAELDDEIEKYEEMQKDLLERSAIETGPSLVARLDQLLTTLQAKKVIPELVNAHLRQLFARVTVNYTTGSLVFDWKHGGQSLISYAWAG